MRSFSVLIVGLLLVATLPFAAPNALAASSAHGYEHHFPPLPPPSNLQVLPKNISEKQLLTTMHGFTQSLGVSCSFCHAEDPSTGRLDFALDTNPHKNIARTMLRMTETINAKYLSTVTVPNSTEKTVSCATCHRGHEIPPAFVAPERHGHPPMPHPVG